MGDEDRQVLEFSEIADADESPWEDDYKTSMRPIMAGFAKEHIWDDEIWDLFIRANINEIRFHKLDGDDLLRKASYVDFDDEEMIYRLKTAAEWEPDIPTDDTVIRRFLSFDRFIDLIDNDGFWLSNIKNFNDDFEASFPNPSVNRSQMFVNFAKERGVENQVSYGVKQRRIRDNHTYVNCWRIGEDESSVFWDAYIGDDEGLAIQTTVGDLCDGISEPVWEGYIDILLRKGVTEAIKEFSKVLLGEVEYLDYESEPISNSLMSPARFFHKRYGFKDEQEFRLIKKPLPLTSVEELPEPKKGIILKGNLQEIINKIILPPNPSESYEMLVREVSEEWLNIPVEDSSLTQNPNKVDMDGI
mgnify:CR=1 FL=1